MTMGVVELFILLLLAGIIVALIWGVLRISRTRRP